jgi:DNA-binding FadR family transcriptional regulator
MDALSRTPLSHQAADALLDDVRGGRWEVGQQLPSEMALATELKVGRSTVREAIRHLVASGVLTTRQGIGVFLESTTPLQPWDRIAEIAEITEVVQVRVAIESRAAALAATFHVKAEAAAIRRALKKRNDLLGGDAPVLAAADIDFHRQVVAASHNKLLLTLFESLQPRLVRVMTDLLMILPGDHQDAAEHDAVVEAIVARDAERAETLTRTHLLDLARLLEQPS